MLTRRRAVGRFATGLRARFYCVFVATLGLFLLTHGGHFYAVNGDTVFHTAQSLLMYGTLAVEPVLGTVPGRGGKSYGAFGIGLSLLQIPFLVAASFVNRDSFGSIYGLDVLTFAATLVGPFFAALGAAEFWVIAEQLGYPPAVVAWLTGILVVATQFWPAARDGFPHIVVASLILVIVRRAMTWRDAGSAAAPFRTGCAAGLLILVRSFDAALTLPLLTIYLLRQDWQQVWRERRFLDSNLGRFLIPAAISVMIIGLDNTLRWGDPRVFMESGGFGAPFFIGFRGLLIGVRRGIVFYSPPVVATIPGLIILARRRRAEALLFAALMAVYPIAYATYSHWHGDLCWGPRFLVPAVPLAVLPLGELLMMGGAAKALVLALGLAGLLVQLGATLVNFTGAASPAFYSDPNYSQIVANWQALLAGKYLDWLPIQIYATHGLAAAIKYSELPLAMMILGSVSLALVLRSKGPSSREPLTAHKLDPNDCQDSH